MQGLRLFIVFNFLLLTSCLVSGFWLSAAEEQSKCQVEWAYPQQYLFPMAKHILAHHQKETLGREIDCNVTLRALGPVIIVKCPENEGYQPPTKQQANEILLAMPKAVEHYRTVQRYYRNVNEETRNVLLALWSECRNEPATWEQIIETMPD